MPIDPAIKALLDSAGGDDFRQLAFGYSEPSPADPPSGDRLRARMAVGLNWESRTKMAEAAAEACPAIVTEAFAVRDAMTAALHCGHLKELIEACNALRDAAYRANGTPADLEDSKADSEEKNPMSERVLRAIKYVNDYNDKVAKGKANKIPRNAILSIHLDKPVQSKAVKNLDRQVRKYRHRLRTPADS